MRERLLDLGLQPGGVSKPKEGTWEALVEPWHSWPRGKVMPPAAGPLIRLKSCPTKTAQLR